MTPPIVRLIMQVARVPEEVAKIILDYIPVRRRLTVSPYDPVREPAYELQYYTGEYADHRGNNIEYVPHYRDWNEHLTWSYAFRQLPRWQQGGVVSLTHVVSVFTFLKLLGY